MLAIKNISKNKNKIGCSLAYALFCFLLISSLNAQNWQAIANRPPYTADYRVLYSDSIDNYLYVGGHFASVNGLPTKGIARWDGAQWDSLHWGVDEISYPNSIFHRPVASITRYHGDIIVGGQFWSIGDKPILGLGRWDGNNWDSLSIHPFKQTQQLEVNVGVLKVINDKLFVGGLFDSIAGQPCKDFAIWDGNTNIWNPVGLPSELVQAVTVNAICEYQGEVYVGGNFSMGISSDTIRAIIRWDGSNWKSVGGGMQGVWSIVNDLEVYNNELYVAGDFYEADGNQSNAIQKWDGIQWSEVGGGMVGPGTGAIWDMAVHGNKLYVTGLMEYAGGTSASKIAVWDGNQWCGLGSTFDGIGNVVGFYKDTLYMTGGFYTIDGDSIYRLAQWLAGDSVANCATYGINEENFDFIKLYPNPAENYVTISIDDLDLFGSCNYAIYNLLGAQVKTGNVSQAQTIIDLLGFSPGIYSIEIIIDNKKVTKKLLKL